MSGCGQVAAAAAAIKEPAEDPLQIQAWMFLLMFLHSCC